MFEEPEEMRESGNKRKILRLGGSWWWMIWGGLDLSPFLFPVLLSPSCQLEYVWGSGLVAYGAHTVLKGLCFTELHGEPLKGFVEGLLCTSDWPTTYKSLC